LEAIVSFVSAFPRSDAMTRNTLLAGATLLCLAATPAIAGESTPAEKEATRQLNLQAARDAAPSPQQVAPQQMAALDRSAGMPAGATPAAAPTPVQAAESTAPFASAQSLSDITSPPSKIATANVLDSTGKTVGAVQKVEISPEGKPTKVSVAMIGAQERTVVLDASQVSYDAHKNEITAKGDIPAG
jgi:hypothetical protein